METAMKFSKRTMAATLAASTTLGVAGPAWADGGGVAAGLFGGMLLEGAIRSNRDYERRSAYESGYSMGAYSQPPQRTVVVQQQPVAGGGGGSAEQKLTQLANMKQKGLISEQEYQAKKKAILDAM
jgi:hypothetical protein